ncbi:membrane protein [Mycolicibacterium wolinskyi]|uniref:Membrane protein n=1 Tax=Mycolicibacterium wolinskyi TaxID=59750 RepID=A0A132PUQ7_9MYCO|nr:hypothetical protein [Mycolicibacterium wolinskyi]KWX26088.1 membrane protein [Mycolicibacterium wolinskyi]
MSTLSRRRWWVLRALGRNPLVRRFDRIEAMAVVLATVFAVLVIPYAVSVGEDVYGESLRSAREQAQTRIPTQATVVSDSAPAADNAAVSIVSVKWTAAGSEHTGVIRPSQPVSEGDQVQIWVDGKGRRVPPPTSPATATGYGTAAALGIWLSAVALGAMAVAATRKVLNRYRLNAWSDELHVLLDRGDGRTKWPR